MLLLDTDVMVDVMRGHDPALQWLDTVSDEPIVLPGFVVMELIQGCDSHDERDLLLREIEQFQIAWPSPETSQAALEVFADVHFSHGTGLLDALIGQLAVALGTPLLTFNEAHYAPIPDLRTDRPYTRAS
jgi:predicted nucleic acid-binding protein